jgi:hypothetical protein
LAPCEPATPGSITDPSSKRHSMQAAFPSTQLRLHQQQQQLHIDSVRPEIIVLSALMIAFKFLVDCQEPTRYYRTAWGKDLWTSDQINVTERCIMENLGYRILPLWDPVLIEDAKRDMQRAARQATISRSPSAPSVSSSHQNHPRNGESHKRAVSSTEGSLLRHHHPTLLPLTPAETPVLEKSQANALEQVAG